MSKFICIEDHETGGRHFGAGSSYSSEEVRHSDRPSAFREIPSPGPAHRDKMIHTDHVKQKGLEMNDGS